MSKEPFKKPVVSELGAVIDMSIENFKSFCADKDMGYLKGLENLMTLTYNNLQQMREDIRVKVQKRELTVEDSTEVVKGLHSKMMRVEERVFTVRELQTNRSIKDPEEEC